MGIKGLIGLIAFGLALSVQASESVMPILYPETKEPYLTVFKDTIKGISREVDFATDSRAIKKQMNIEEVDQWVESSKAPLSIALGHRSLNALHASASNVPIIAAAFLTVPDNMSDVVVALTYTPDPKHLFKILKRLSPEVHTVHVVINEQRWEWLLAFARSAAQSTTLQLKIHNASNVHEAARIYSRLLEEMDPQIESLWLPQDNTTLDKTVIIPLVLDRLWERKLKVFSSSLSLVNRGVLFGVFPDNYEMGQYLGELSNAILKGNQPKENIQPLRQLNEAINIRTAEHLDIRVKHKLMKKFELVLPKNAR